VITPIYANHPNPEKIEWKYMTKEDYLDIEEILTKDVVFFEPFLVDEFFPPEMFEELLEILTSYDLNKVDFSHQMNKWEEGVQIPQKFMDYAVEKVRGLLGTEDVHFAYHMYAHHQITSEGRVPRLPLHIDHAPGPYMVDLHIGGNRDWGFVAGNTNFITKPNQAIICQPQFDYHYRPSWANNDPDEYYQAIFFHLINKNHWCVPSESKDHTRSEELNSKFKFGQHFRDTDSFVNYTWQRRYMFDRLYLEEHAEIGLPPIPWDEIPTAEDAGVHQRKGVQPLSNVDNKG
jgi:hypothetical protein